MIDKGEFVFIVGASGSGKSTLIRLLLKELEPTTGPDPRRRPRPRRACKRVASVPQLRRNVGCVFQDFKLLPNRTAAENVAYALKVQGEPTREIRRKVPEVLSWSGLVGEDELATRTSSRAASSSASRSRAPSSTTRRS